MQTKELMMSAIAGFACTGMAIAAHGLLGGDAKEARSLIDLHLEFGEIHNLACKELQANPEGLVSQVLLVRLRAAHDSYPGLMQHMREVWEARASAR
jgi:hypothetical protein